MGLSVIAVSLEVILVFMDIPSFEEEFEIKVNFFQNPKKIVTCVNFMPPYNQSWKTLLLPPVTETIGDSS